MGAILCKLFFLSGPATKKGGGGKAGQLKKKLQKFPKKMWALS